MNKIRVLNKIDIEKNLNMQDVVIAVEEAYALNSQKEIKLFDTVFHDFEEGKADMDIKSGTIDKAGIYGFKIMSWFSENEAKGLSSLMGNIMLYDRSTGAPIALLEGASITGMRTGAAGGIAAKYLARKDSRELLMVGTGNQAPFQIASALMMTENIEKVTVYNPHSYESAVKFSKKIKGILRDDFLSKFKGEENIYEMVEKKYDVEFIACDDLEAAVRRADIIVTATPSRKAMIKKEWLKKGTHLTCIGSDMEGKQEIDENIFSVARVFTDDAEKTSKVGEMEIAIKKGIFSKNDIVCEIGEVILGHNKGRITDDEITIFDASGLAAQDLLTAKVLMEKAEKFNLGTVIEL
ncbi:MAG: ornithine cyclodeaminase family protein [Sedimentibacter sp.]